MTLDFSKCKTPEDVKAVFEAAKRDLEIARSIPQLMGFKTPPHPKWCHCERCDPPTRKSR